MEHKRYNGIAILLGVLAVCVIVCAVWGPELFAEYQNDRLLNRIQSEAVEGENESYRYALTSNEKLYLLSQCLNNQVLPETELSAMTRVNTEEDYGTLTGTYALVVNYQGPSDKEIKEEDIYQICNEQIKLLKEMEILPSKVREVNASSYEAVLYSAIDVLDPRNNLSVWKVSLATRQQNANKSNRLLDIYLDADTGQIYEFYVRSEREWTDIDPEQLVGKWATYLGLTDMEPYDTINPLAETTPHFAKYHFPGMDNNQTTVTVGFYEGINELFLKISQ